MGILAKIVIFFVKLGVSSLSSLGTLTPVRSLVDLVPMRDELSVNPVLIVLR